MRGTARRLLAENEEAEVQQVLRYEGDTSTKLHRVKILIWMYWAQEVSGECPRYVDKPRETTNKVGNGHHC